ncbi:MAG: glycoside hydrolase family 16 protein [Planctomycetaceae bacterium]|nr:glycoside hydrolase family 16 protein [Planctomycetaceae bacterium]
MKHTALLMIVTVFCAVVWANLYAAEPAPPLEKPGWKLTFHDEFDKPLLNDLYWYPAYRTGRIEYLKRIGAEGIYQDPNAYYKLEDGILKLMIDEKIPSRSKKSDRAVSCIMTSDHRFGNTIQEYQLLEKFAQKYGWFETRCKTVTGSGVYCAFWLHQTDPLDQEVTPEGRRKNVGEGVVEIDIFEQLGKDTKAGLNLFNIHFTKDAHYTLPMGFDPSEDFHVYAMEWKTNEINWYVDGKVIQSYKGETPKKKMFILLALFHRYLPDWAGELDPNLTYPKTFEVDYVRVYLPEEK